MSDENSKKLYDMEFRRGRLDGESGEPPSSLVGPYMEGYIDGRSAAHNRTATPGGMPAVRVPETPPVPYDVINRLRNSLLDPMAVLTRPAKAWGNKSAVEYVRDGGSWGEVVLAFENLTQ